MSFLYFSTLTVTSLVQFLIMPDLIYCNGLPVDLPAPYALPLTPFFTYSRWYFRSALGFLTAQDFQAFWVVDPSTRTTTPLPHLQGISCVPHSAFNLFRFQGRLGLVSFTFLIIPLFWPSCCFLSKFSHCDLMRTLHL